MLPLTNPLFMTIVLGLIAERCIRVLHLGPPCSSFSMACNRFKMYAMRSREEPQGFQNIIASVTPTKNLREGKLKEI